jgi:hypothetical protein
VTGQKMRELLTDRASRPENADLHLQSRHANLHS